MVLLICGGVHVGVLVSNVHGMPLHLKPADLQPSQIRRQVMRERLNEMQVATPSLYE